MRIASILLVIVMLLCFTACEFSGIPTSPDYPVFPGFPEEPVFSTDEEDGGIILPEEGFGFDGETVKIWTRSGGTFEKSSQFYAGSLTGDKAMQAAATRNSEIEETYDVTLEFDSTTTVDAVKANLLADAQPYHILSGNTNNMVLLSLVNMGGTATTPNALVDLKNDAVASAVINLEDAYWDQAMNAGLATLNQQYFVAGDFNMNLTNATIITINKNFLPSGVTADSIYEMVQNNEWTWDELVKLAKNSKGLTYADKSGTATSTGVALAKGRYLNSKYLTLGLQWIDPTTGKVGFFDTNGEILSAYEQAHVEIRDNLIGFWAQNAFYTSYNETSKEFDNFRGGTTTAPIASRPAIAQHDLWIYKAYVGQTQYLVSSNDVIIVPAPLFTGANGEVIGEYVSTFSDATTFYTAGPQVSAIPTNNPNMAASVFLLNRLNKNSTKVVNEYKKDVLGANYTDTAAKAAFDLAVDNIAIDFIQAYSVLFGQVTDTSASSIVGLLYGTDSNRYGWTFQGLNANIDENPNKDWTTSDLLTTWVTGKQAALEADAAKVIAVITNTDVAAATE